MNNNINSRRNFLSKMLITSLSGVTLLSSTTYAKGNINSTRQITDAQKDTLFFIYQEEKVARDFYITLGRLYPNENTFLHLSNFQSRDILILQEYYVKNMVLALMV